MSAGDTQSIAVVHPTDPTRPTVIPAAMYDPTVHTRWEDRGPRPEPAPALPKEFPGKRELEAAGYHTLEAVREVRDFDEIPGIGQKTEERIVAWLGGSHAGEDDDDGNG